MISFTIDGKPMSKSNSYRMGKGKYYVPKAQKDYEAKVLDAAKQSYLGDALEGEIEMEIRLFFPDKRRRDAQNYTKSICDALNGVVYKDDSQIVRITITKTLDRDKPRAEVMICLVN